MRRVLLAISFPGSNLLGIGTAQKQALGSVFFLALYPRVGTHIPAGTATPRATHFQQVAHQAVQLRGGVCGGCEGPRLGKVPQGTPVLLLCLCVLPPLARHRFLHWYQRSKRMNSKLQTSLVQCHFNIQSVTKTPMIHRCIFSSIFMCPNIQSKFCLPPQLGHFAFCTSNP